MHSVAESQPSRQGYVSAALLLPPGAVPQRAGEVQPAWFRFIGLLDCQPEWSGQRWVGSWLNCQFHYCKPGAAFPYHIEAAVYVSRGKKVGRVYLRCCSCPDGLARTDRAGAARHCKHMVALAAQLRQPEVPATSVSLVGQAWAIAQAMYANQASA